MQKQQHRIAFLSSMNHSDHFKHHVLSFIQSILEELSTLLPKPVHSVTICMVTEWNITELNFLTYKYIFIFKDLSLQYRSWCLKVRFQLHIFQKETNSVEYMLNFYKVGNRVDQKNVTDLINKLYTWLLLRKKA